MAQIARKLQSEAGKLRSGTFFFYGREQDMIFLRQWQETYFRIAQRSGNTCFLATDKKNFL